MTGWRLCSEKKKSLPERQRGGALHLTASAGKPDRDAAAVILQLDYLDQRPETEQAAAWMEQIHLTAEPKTEG